VHAAAFQKVCADAECIGELTVHAGAGLPGARRFNGGVHQLQSLRQARGEQCAGRRNRGKESGIGQEERLLRHAVEPECVERHVFVDPVKKEAESAANHGPSGFVRF